MNKKFLVILILVLAAILRFWNYADFPVGGETDDEKAWTLIGASLIQDGVPSGWSYFDVYKDGYIYEEGVYDAPIVRPDLDFPPIFALLPGAAHSLKHHWMDYPSIKLIRSPLVLLGIINVALFWLVSKKYFKEKWALFATLLFATMPVVVFGSRLVVSENLLITWILISLWLVKNKKQKHRFSLLLTVSALAIMTKTSGIVLPISLVLYGLLDQKKELIKAGFWGGLLGIILFAFYGAFYNWDIFLEVLSSQSTRQLGLATLQNRLFLNPAVVEKMFFDGWKMLGLFATVFMFGRKKKEFLLPQIITILSLLFILLGSDEINFHGWYDYIFFPTMTLSLVSMIKYAFKEKTGLLFGFIWVLLLPVVRLALVTGDYYHSFSKIVVRVVMVLGFIPMGFGILKQKKLKYFAMKLILVILVLANVTTVLEMTSRKYWENNGYFLPTMRER